MNLESALRTAGITYKQFDHWSGQGYFGEELKGPGSGRSRPVPGVARIEAVRALVALRTGVGGFRVEDIVDQLIESGSHSVRCGAYSISVQRVMS